MGIDVDSKLMVGCSYQELEPFFEKIIELGETSSCALDNETDVIEHYFDYASPFYDSWREDWFIGFEIENYQVVGVELHELIQQASDKFFKLTGIIPRLRGGCHVW